MVQKLRQEKTEDGWTIATVSDLTGGLNLDVAIEQLEPDASPDLENVRFDRDRVKTDTGYKLFGQTVRGTPRRTFQFVRKNGVSELMLITNGTLYKWSEVHDEWQYVSSGVSTTVTVGASAGQSVITIASATGLATGDVIGVFLDNGQQHQAEILDLTGTTLTMNIPVPPGRSIQVGTTILEPITLGGNDDEGVQVLTVPSHDWMVFTNGVVGPQRYNGTDCIQVPNLPSGGNFFCKTIALMNGYLLLGNTTEGGARFPQRIRWPDTNNPENWTTGNAGFVDLFGKEDPIIRLQPLGPYLIVYREDAIDRGHFINTDTKIWEFEPTNSERGPLSVGSLVDLGDAHLFPGEDDFYLYAGGLDAASIGRPIQRKLFGPQGELAEENAHRIFGFHIPTLKEVWWAYPSGNSPNLRHVARFNLKLRNWSIRVLADPIIGFGFYQTVETKTWQDITFPWTEWLTPWNSGALLSGSPTLQLASSEASQVMQYDYETLTDNGTPIAYRVTTKSFTVPDHFIRLDWLECLVTGASIEIAYSSDNGQTWILLGTVAPGSLAKRVKLHRQVVAQQLMFRWLGSGPFELGWFSFAYREESRWGG